MPKNTRPLGKGTRNLTANVPNDLYVEICRLASVSGTKLGEYVRTIMEDAVARDVVVRQNLESFVRWVDAVKAGEHPLPKIRLEIATPLNYEQGLRVAEGEPDKKTRPKKAS